MKYRPAAGDRVIAKRNFRNGGRLPAGRHGKPAGLPHHFGNFLLATCNSLLLSINRLAAAASDRKSTRLNSSHSQISYAVFCLKKKKYAIEYCSGSWLFIMNRHSKA